MRTVHYIKSNSPEFSRFRMGEKFTDRDQWLAEVNQLKARLTGNMAFSYWTEQECETCMEELDLILEVGECEICDGHVEHSHTIADVCPECGARAAHHFVRFASGLLLHLIGRDDRELSI